MQLLDKKTNDYHSLIGDRFSLRKFNDSPPTVVGFVSHLRIKPVAKAYNKNK